MKAVFSGLMSVTVMTILTGTQFAGTLKRKPSSMFCISVRTALNEIDAKEYLISVAEKYKIPVEETELTKQQLEYYKHCLEELEEKP